MPIPSASRSTPDRLVSMSATTTAGYGETWRRWCQSHAVCAPNVEFPAMDAIDRAILSHLQEDGRLSNVELAERVRLSPSACLRRVRNLEASGAIAGYHA